jgi:hypothetical protein
MAGTGSSCCPFVLVDQPCACRKSHPRRLSGIAQQAGPPGRTSRGPAGTRTSPLLSAPDPTWADGIFGTGSADCDQTDRYRPRQFSPCSGHRHDPGRVRRLFVLALVREPEVHAVGCDDLILASGFSAAWPTGAGTGNSQTRTWPPGGIISWAFSSNRRRSGAAFCIPGFSNRVMALLRRQSQQPMLS